MKGLTKVGMTRDGYRRTQGSGNDRIERAAPKPQTHWDTVLVWFMRVVARALWTDRRINHGRGCRTSCGAIFMPASGLFLGLFAHTGQVLSTGCEEQG